jgi:predicted lipid-binding transport protein (Tim44 family)
VAVVRRLAPVLLAVATFAACGGEDKGDAEQTVRDFVNATNERDTEKLCDDLVTQEFLEQLTGATGDKARDACKQQLKSQQAIDIDLEGIKKTEVDGDKATVTATLAAQGQTQDRILRLEKEGGDWRLAGGTGD